MSDSFDTLPPGFTIQPARRAMPQGQGQTELPPGFKVEPPAAQQPSLAERFTAGARDLTQFYLQDLAAAQQRTSPIVRNIEGELNRALAPEEDQFLYSEQGIVRPGRVVLIDPADRKPKVFLESPETREGLASGAGRVIGAGAITSPPTTRPGRGMPVPGITQRAQAFRETGVDPTLGGLTQSAPARMAENILDQTFTSAGIMERARERSLRQTAAATGRLAGQYGEASTPRQAGQGLRRGLGAEQGFVDRFTKQSGKLYDAVDRFIPRGTQVDISRTRDAMTDAFQRFDNPELAQEFIDPTLKRWAGLLDEAGGALSYNDLKQFRTEVGQKLGRPALLRDIDERQLSNVYAAMSDDLLEAARGVGPQAARAVERANRYYRAGRTRIREALTEILGERMSEEGAYRFIEQLSSEKGARASARKLGQIRRSLQPEEWNEVAAAMINQLGVPPPSARVGLDAPTFSPATFMTNYERLAPEARSILFDRTGQRQLRRALDNLVTVMESQKNVERLANPSGTGRIVGNVALAGSALVNPAIAIMGAVGAPAAASLITNPRFVSWLAALPNVRSQPQLVRHFATLRQFARNNEDIQQFSDHLEEQLGRP